MRAVGSVEQHVTLLQMYLWYQAAAFVEGFHPMMTGFFRLEPRNDRRDGLASEGRLRHLRRRFPELARVLGGYWNVLATLKRLWEETAPLPIAPQSGPLGSDGNHQTWRSFVRAMFLGLPRPAPAAPVFRARLRPVVEEPERR